MDQISAFDSLTDQVLKGLRKNSKEIPFSLLYHGKGSEIYDEITQLEEYYPYRAEVTLFKKNADRIAATISPGSLVVELGCGTATKSAYLVNALQARYGRCQYAGIDISGSALKGASKNLLQQVIGLASSSVHLVQDDNLEGLKQVRQKFPNEIFCILWLGSSVGSLSDDGAMSFLKEVLEIVGTKCQFFLCTDMWKDETTLHRAYYDQKGVTERFIKNGMRNALNLLGHVATQDEEDSWIYHVEVNKQLRRVEMFLVFSKGLHIEQHQVHIRSGESVLVEFSRKFQIQDIQELAYKSGFIIHEAWRNKVYGCQMLVPGLQSLLCCWDDTDALFRKIPDWRAKPIDLRHPFCFYYGHVNAFTRLKLLSRDGASELDDMFSRGIDPIVLDPLKCHGHPEAPPEWPSSEMIVAYVESNRILLKEAIKGGKVSMRLLYMVLEHERMHQETLAYMVTQQRKLSFEKHIFLSDNKTFEDLMKDGLRRQVSNLPNVCIPSGKVLLGSEPRDGVFVWDNEQPIFQENVSKPFLVSSKPVTIQEYLSFILEGGYDKEDLWEPEDFTFFQQQGFKWPATWSIVGDNCYLHGPYSTRHWSEVAHQPVFVSLSEAQAYCKWVGCRIMTEAEYHRIVDFDWEENVSNLRDEGWEWTSTCFKPFPGFQPLSEYKEYSTDFFDGKHFVLKGSSPVTNPSIRRDSFRNFYQRQYRYVFAKFRCCK